MSDDQIAPARRPSSADPDRLAQLEDERRFLLSSLDDLEREYAVGDVEDEDYRELRDGYTVRAAAVLRAIEDGRNALPTKTSVNWPRRIAAIAITGALVGVVWWALSASSAQRLPGQGPTGADPRSEEQQLLAQARSAQLAAPGQAAQLYDLVLEEDPDNVEALAYGGWTRALAAMVQVGQDDSQENGAVDSDHLQAELVEALGMLNQATTVDPAYPDPYCFRGIIYANFLESPQLAVDDLTVCQDNNPPADVANLVSGLLAQVTASTPTSP